MELYNKKSRAELEILLDNELFKRVTLSFYRYVKIDNPVEYRHALFARWNALQCLGRIYVASEGINAQMSVPEHNLDAFLLELDNTPGLAAMPIKYALDNNGKSFYKLTIKVRPKIVADGLSDHEFDVSNVGNHLSAREWHNLVNKPDVLVIDMRNHYESEIGRFKNAYCPNTDTFKQTIDHVLEKFEHQKNKKVLLYCTGGVRCEKASAYFKHHGFTDVNQLHGGIIAYANEVKQLGLLSHFMGKNFVFDGRLGESVDGTVISRCHQCGEPADTHTNCANADCHLLFIQCPACSAKYKGCCTNKCMEVTLLPAEQQAQIRKARHLEYAQSKIFKSRLRPELVIGQQLT